MVGRKAMGSNYSAVFYLERIFTEEGLICKYFKKCFVLLLRKYQNEKGGPGLWQQLKNHLLFTY